jgi:hypothetical protein
MAICASPDSAKWPMSKWSSKAGDYFPATMTVKLLGKTVGRGRGFSAVAAGGGPNWAVTT